MSNKPITFKSETRPPLVEPVEIVVCGKVVGTADPWLTSGGALRWHAKIDLSSPGNVYLVQGHGDTPADAVADGIIEARREQHRQRLALANLEELLDVFEMDDASVIEHAATWKEQPQ